MNLRLAYLHCRAEVLQHMRAPSYIVPALVFPTMFFLYFGAQAVRDSAEANLVLASYATYTFMGVAFYQFTGGIVEDRRTSWGSYLRTLPGSYRYTWAGWALAGLIIGLAALFMVTMVAVLATDVAAPPLHWVSLGVAILCGSLPMALLAAAIGYWVASKSALQVATLLYFTLAYASGIWTSPELLPGWLQQVSPFLPTRLWAELSWASVQGQAWPTQDWVGLAGYTALFGVLAVRGFSRQERRRYG